MRCKDSLEFPITPASTSSALLTGLRFFSELSNLGFHSDDCLQIALLLQPEKPKSTRQKWLISYRFGIKHYYVLEVFD